LRKRAQLSRTLREWRLSVRVLSDGRPRVKLPTSLGWFLAGVVWLAVVGAFVTVRALVEWLT
jgi:hypothetical protein